MLILAQEVAPLYFYTKRATRRGRLVMLSMILVAATLGLATIVAPVALHGQPNLTLG